MACGLKKPDAEFGIFHALLTHHRMQWMGRLG